MKKSKITLFIIFVIAITIIPIVISFWAGGMFDLVNQTFGPIIWVGVIIFIAILLGIIFFGMKLARKALQPKTIKDGLPAIATVINCRQGNMKISIGGVNQNYQLIIAVNVTNPLGETWETKMTEMVNITQIGIFQPGVKFKVLYDPGNRSNVVIDETKE